MLLAVGFFVIAALVAVDIQERGLDRHRKHRYIKEKAAVSHYLPIWFGNLKLLKIIFSNYP